MLDTELGRAQTGLFSSAQGSTFNVSTFIVDVQSKLEPDPNETTATYTRILIHAVNASLFPDADPSSITWTGPPAEIVTIQSLLYAILETSLPAAVLAMLGKQWANRYIRKLNGLEKWYFRLTVESLPVVLQLAARACPVAVPLDHQSPHRLGHWCIHAFEVTSYTFFAFAATPHYDRPYQTPYTAVPSHPRPSILNKLPNGKRLRCSIRGESSHHYSVPILLPLDPQLYVRLFPRLGSRPHKREQESRRRGYQGFSRVQDFGDQGRKIWQAYPGAARCVCLVVPYRSEL